MIAPKSFESFDEALEMLAPYATEFGGGLSNHGPMACEALCAMGHADAVRHWVERYRTHLDPKPSASGRIRDDWSTELGNYRRIADWIATFDAELEEASWAEVLDRWVARLAPGISAAALHGVIRAGHATRALTVGENALRRHELAQALGYWAARFETLPEQRGRRGAARPLEALRNVEMLPPELRRAGLLTANLAQLEHFAPFAQVAERVDTSGDSSQFLSELTACFARVYLTNSISPLTTIAFIHSITGPSALRPMLPYLSRETIQSALRYAWQAAAAMFSAFGTERDFSRVGELKTIAPDDLIDRAVANGDEHAIKLTEVCLREYGVNPDAAYLGAATDAVGRL